MIELNAYGASEIERYVHQYCWKSLVIIICENYLIPQGFGVCYIIVVITVDSCDLVTRCFQGWLMDGVDLCHTGTTRNKPRTLSRISGAYCMWLVI